MALFTWSEKYSVGNVEIDNQHKKLFEIINNISDMSKMGMTPEVKRVLDELVVYTKMHLSFEEKILASVNYPDLDKHKRLHEDLKLQLKDFEDKLSEGTRISIVTVIKFLNSWLNDHIMKEDFAYRPFLKK